MGTLLAVLLTLPSVALERPKPPSAMAARRAAAQPSAMAQRRSGAAAPPAAPDAPAVPAAAPDPVFGPRITPPTGSPLTAFDRQAARGVAYAPAAPAAPEPPAAPVSAEGAPGAGPERAPAGVKGSAVTELKAGRTDRQFGGASDPVLFLLGGTGPSGSVTTGADGSSLSIELGTKK